MDVAGLAHLVWLVLLIAVGFPVALGIELYLRGGTWWKSRAEHESHYNAAFMKVPEDSAIARRMREPVRAALPEPE
jgi:hypothetical protein